MELKKINKIKPFNRFALGNCMEYAYIPMFTYFGGTEFEYFLNKRTYFHYKNESFCITTAEDIDMEQMTKKHGICISSVKDFDSDIVNTTVNLLAGGSLIMIRVVGAEAYDVQTKHITEKSSSEHWILCFGYNLETREFDILEHETNVAAVYKHCRISFLIYETSYSKANFEGGELNKLIMNKCRDSLDNGDFRKEYICKKINNEDNFKRSTACLLNFMDDFYEEVSCESDFKYDYVLIITELLKYYHRELWLLEQMDVIYDSVGLIKILNIVRSFTMKYTLYPSLAICNMLCAYIIKAKEEVSKFSEFEMLLLEGEAVCEL